MRHASQPLWFIVLLLVVAARVALCDPRADLESPSQEVRDAAAKILRAAPYTPPPREQWDKVMELLQIGSTKADVMKILAPYHPSPDMSVGGGGAYSECYRFDDVWLIQCGYRDKGDVLFSKSLIKLMWPVQAKMPEHYTGVWRTYYPNGQPGHEIHFKDGKVSGEFISFREDGSKCTVQHYDPQGCDGEEVDYFPSGQVCLRGTYKAGKMVGTWTWYGVDGGIAHTQVYPNP